MAKCKMNRFPIVLCVVLFILIIALVIQGIRLRYSCKKGKREAQNLSSPFHIFELWKYDLH